MPLASVTIIGQSAVSADREGKKVDMLLLSLLMVANVCQPWCLDATCSELNGDVESECGSCSSTHACWAGAHEFVRVSTSGEAAMAEQVDEHAKQDLEPQGPEGAQHAAGARLAVDWQRAPMKGAVGDDRHLMDDELARPQRASGV